MAMTTARAVIDGYAQLRQQVADMLHLARSGEWDVLIEQQTRYLQLAARLRQLDREASLEPADIECKAELLEAILGDDLAIRERLLARQSELGQLMDTGRRQRELHRSYGRQATAVIDASDKFGSSTP